VVITPPATYDTWHEWAGRFGMTVETMSHAKFRMPGTKVSRTVPMIVDEFHLLGGHKGKGWKKMDTLGLRLQAPLIGLSATPNYNDAERVYCIQHVFDPHSAKGGYLEFLYTHCETEQNFFGVEPDVTGFRHFKDAASYLESLWFVEYLPDDLVYKIEDLPVPAVFPQELVDYGLNIRKDRIIASEIERRHALVDLGLVNTNGGLNFPVLSWLNIVISGRSGPVLVFAAHSTVADACDKELATTQGLKVAKVTGKTPEKTKAERIAAFRDGVLDVLIGTATLATGTDGLDKVCDRMVILDDTDDDSLRRQLIGRIMPRGLNVTKADMQRKQIYRIVLQ